MRYNEIYRHAKRLTEIVKNRLYSETIAALTHDFFVLYGIENHKLQRDITNVHMWLILKDEGFAKTAAYILSGETLTYKIAESELGLSRDQLYGHMERLRESYKIAERYELGHKEFWLEGVS